MEIAGIAHIILTVRDVTRSRAFYVALCEHMGLERIVDVDTYLYYVGGKTAVGLRPGTADRPFDQGHVGLHHVCFRARSREDVDSVHALLVGMNAKVVHPPQEEPWVPGYYSVLFEDPDGIRLEVNHIPGKGVLDPSTPRPAL